MKEQEERQVIIILKGEVFMNQLLRLATITLIVAGIAAYSHRVFAHIGHHGEHESTSFHDPDNN